MRGQTPATQLRLISVSYRSEVCSGRVYCERERQLVHFLHTSSGRGTIAAGGRHTPFMRRYTPCHMPQIRSSLE
jgi:hypothetical protein